MRIEFGEPIKPIHVTGPFSGPKRPEDPPLEQTYLDGDLVQWRHTPDGDWEGCVAYRRPYHGYGFSLGIHYDWFPSRMLSRLED